MGRAQARHGRVLHISDGAMGQGVLVSIHVMLFVCLLSHRWLSMPASSGLRKGGWDAFYAVLQASGLTLYKSEDERTASNIQYENPKKRGGRQKMDEHSSVSLFLFSFSLSLALSVCLALFFSCPFLLLSFVLSHSGIPASLHLSSFLFLLSIFSCLHAFSSPFLSLFLAVFPLCSFLVPHTAAPSSLIISTDSLHSVTPVRQEDLQYAKAADIPCSFQVMKAVAFLNSLYR